MNGAEKTEHLQDMDEKSGKGDRGHQNHPDITDKAVMSCSFGAPNLESAKARGGQRRNSMNGYGLRGRK